MSDRYRDAPIRPALFALLALLLFLCVGAALAQTPQMRTPTEGERLIERGEWSKAEDHYWDAVKDNPKDALAQRMYGFVQLRQPGGDVVKAVRALGRAHELAPDDPVTHFLLAKAYEAQGEFDQARKTLDALLERHSEPRDPETAGALHLARFVRAYLALAEEDVETAEALFALVLRREPGHGYVLYEQGFLAEQNEDPEAAIEAFQKALDALIMWAPMESWPYPQGRYAYLRENARYELGRMQLQAGQPAEAKATLEPLLSLVEMRDNARKRPTNVAPPSPLQGETDARFENAPFYHAAAVAALGDKKEASKLYRSFSRMDVGDPELRDEAKDRYRELR